MMAQRLSDEGRAEIAARLATDGPFLDDVDALLDHVQWADERIRELEAALGFYAKHGNYWANESVNDEIVEVALVVKDHGACARAAIHSEPQPVKGKA